jgi:sugar/nucleoside kinase (ribokinase family)
VRFLRIDDDSPFQQLIGVGGLGTGIFFALEGNHTLGRSESRAGRLLEVRDYCKLHIVTHNVARLLPARVTGLPFHVLPIGHVGDDPAGLSVIRQMSEAGIDTSQVRAMPGMPTLFSVCFQYPDGTGGNITTCNSAADTLCENNVDGVAHLLAAGRHRVIALVVPEVPLEVRKYFLQVASRTEAFRAASFVGAEVQLAREKGMFDLLDLVALNDGEAEVLVGQPLSLETPAYFLRSCQEFLSHSNPNLKMVVSAGGSGAYGLTARDCHFCPAPKVEVASTAGAGDALLGGVLAAIAAGIPFLPRSGSPANRPDRSIESALQLGVLLASYKCQSPHTISPSACLDTLVEFASSVALSFSPEVERLFVTGVPTQSLD